MHSSRAPRYARRTAVHASSHVVEVSCSAACSRSPCSRAGRGGAPPPSRTPRRSRSGSTSWASSAACSTSRRTPTTRTRALLAYLANGALVRAGYLSLTRGDGGQNLIGSEQGPALGLIRTQELLAARRIDGAEQFFTRARDFGYSKSPDETLRIWGQDAVLADVVARHPPVSPRRDRHALLARAGATRTATTPPRRCWRWRRSTPPPIRSSPRAARERRRAVAGAAHLLEPVVVAVKPGDDLTGDSSSSTSAATTRCSASPTARSRPTAAACTRARASAWRAQRGPSLEYFKLLAGDADRSARRSTASVIDRRRRRAAARPGAARSARRARREELRSRMTPARAIPALARDRRARSTAARRRLARAEARGGRRCWCWPAPGCSPRRRRRAPCVARRDRRVTATAVARRPAAVKLRDGRAGRSRMQPVAIGARAGARRMPLRRRSYAVTMPARAPPTTPYWLERRRRRPGLYASPIRR